jgi:hypothetical protein
MARVRGGDRLGVAGVAVTPVDLAAFQRLHYGPDGVKLNADGNLGPKTAWALALEALPHWRQNVVLGALKWVGLKETSENRGVEIDAWLEACGAQSGNPWCAAFVSAVLRGAGISCAEASVARLAAKYPEIEVPLPGDISYWLRDDGTGHCGIVTGVGPHYVSVCEGNSNDGVRVGFRDLALLHFVRPMGQGVPEVWSGLLMLGSKTR